MIGLLNKFAAGRVAGNLGLYGAAAGMTAWQGAGRLMGRTGRAAATGALGGGMYGLMSNDTSVLGGMAMGAGLGVGVRAGRIAYGGARFGGRLWSGGRMEAGTGLHTAMARGAGRALASTFRREAAAAGRIGSRLASNRGYGFNAMSYNGVFGR